jgi:hypothetical protein
VPATPATYWETAWISLLESWPLNAGIPPPPFVTCRWAVAWSGLTVSRLGPTCPLAPASLSVWQPAQFVVKICLPWADACWVPPA